MHTRQPIQVQTQQSSVKYIRCQHSVDAQRKDFYPVASIIPVIDNAEFDYVGQN